MIINQTGGAGEGTKVTPALLKTQLTLNPVKGPRPSVYGYFAYVTKDEGEYNLYQYSDDYLTAIGSKSSIPIQDPYFSQNATSTYTIGTFQNQNPNLMRIMADMYGPIFAPEAGDSTTVNFRMYPIGYTACITDEEGSTSFNVSMTCTISNVDGKYLCTTSGWMNNYKGFLVVMNKQPKYDYYIYPSISDKLTIKE